MCISREQEEFLAAYRTDEARQAFIDSYGKEKVNFLDSRYDGDNSKIEVGPLSLVAFNYVHDGGPLVRLDEVNYYSFNKTIDLKLIGNFGFYNVNGSGYWDNSGRSTMRLINANTLEYRVAFQYVGNLISGVILGYDGGFLSRLYFYPEV